jgi:hypothetical protein
MSNTRTVHLKSGSTENSLFYTDWPAYNSELIRRSANPTHGMLTGCNLATTNDMRGDLRTLTKLHGA